VYVMVGLVCFFAVACRPSRVVFVHLSSTSSVAKKVRLYYPYISTVIAELCTQRFQ
jgi:hypothetical protein